MRRVAQLADLITGGTDPFDCPDGDCPPGHRVDDAEFDHGTDRARREDAKADGQLTGEEVAAFRQVLKVPARVRGLR